MPDDKKGRNKQADDREKRQRKREMEEARDRADEEEPMSGDADDRLGDLDDALESHEYPTTTDELVEAYGDYEVQTRDGKESVESVLDSTGEQAYDSPDDVRSRILGLIHR
ncbi:DUF5789 family protein [Halopelagius longus]|uniref:DUF2795 domain-containing protein n=1 Tax=Halopelagius longus TaxID=1236180 RepID=A0A1H1DN78_9EURY|nr:hypothetical protein [Halopelagius longus]RDI71403.1 hypothetical protein DWB78_06500 [Halopelagius longus]SDQ77994.1 hypothetical protein SAMN05216278_2498 [Halopelagius longus]